MRLCDMGLDLASACFSEDVDVFGGIPETRVVLENVVAVELVTGEVVLVCVFCRRRVRV
jgi:hypothetical protein